MADQDVARYSVMSLIGASLSEPHINVLNASGVLGIRVMLIIFILHIFAELTFY